MVKEWIRSQSTQRNNARLAKEKEISWAIVILLFLWFIHWSIEIVSYRTWVLNSLLFSFQLNWSLPLTITSIQSRTVLKRRIYSRNTQNDQEIMNNNKQEVKGLLTGTERCLYLFGSDRNMGMRMRIQNQNLNCVGLLIIRKRERSPATLYTKRSNGCWKFIFVLLFSCCWLLVLPLKNLHLKLTSVNVSSLERNTKLVATLHQQLFTCYVFKNEKGTELIDLLRREWKVCGVFYGTFLIKLIFLLDCAYRLLLR